VCLVHLNDSGRAVDLAWLVVIFARLAYSMYRSPSLRRFLPRSPLQERHLTRSSTLLYYQAFSKGLCRRKLSRSSTLGCPRWERQYSFTPGTQFLRNTRSYTSRPVLLPTCLPFWPLPPTYLHLLTLCPSLGTLSRPHGFTDASYEGGSPPGGIVTIYVVICSIQTVGVSPLRR